MTKETKYLYMGTNGTIFSPIHLEGIYSVKKVILIADEDKKLTKDKINFFNRVAVSEEEVSLWEEVAGQK